VAVALLLWLVFGVYWLVVFRRPMNPDTVTALVSLGVVSFTAIIYLTVWMLYNIRIFKKLPKRKIRRRGVRSPVQDFMGRWIVVDHPTRVMKANYIEVNIQSNFVNNKLIEEKVFRTTQDLG
jgi:hypothetical protein